jgi:hypothetical protein
MKTNDYLLVTATVGYSYLFYHQNAGINFLVFTLLFTCILLIRKKELLLNLKWWWAFAISLTGSLGVVITSSALAIIANCLGLLLLSGIAFNSQTSLIFSFLFSIYSVASSMIWIVIDSVNRLNKSQSGDGESKKEKNYKPLALLLVLFMVLLFFAVYKEANPLFAENTKWINLDFISFSWIIFTIGGFFLVYALFYHRSIPLLENWENTLPLNHPITGEKNAKRVEAERFSGMWLFVFLNVMLVILNVGDITSIWFNAALPKGISHSDFVHNGVGMIIMSILIATALIMFLYRANPGQVKYSGVLKWMIYAWILQNLVMLFSTAIRNQIYIHDYNFTYKRIGVYAWLILAGIGLVLTFIKILDDRTNWFLVRANFAIWFTFISAGSLINWDLVITNYNISNKPLKDVDFHYLFSLSDANIPQLLEVTKHKDFASIKDSLRNYRDDRSYYYDETYMNLLHRKIYHYAYGYCSDWQSWDFRDTAINNALTAK